MKFTKIETDTILFALRVLEQGPPIIHREVNAILEEGKRADIQELCEKINLDQDETIRERFFDNWQIEHTGGNVYIATKTIQPHYGKADTDDRGTLAVLTSEALCIYKDREAFDNGQTALQTIYLH